jgi:hypothetical protein
MSRRTAILIAAIVVVVLVVVIIVIVATSGAKKAVAPTPTATASSPAAATPAPLGQRTKTAGCTVNAALPDAACTPGAVFSGATKEQICKPGYAKSVRNVPESEKNQVYAEYGIAHHKAGEYEVDHLVSLELGGSNEIANLWPEAAAPQPGFHQKDRYENYLHAQVCSGAISLEEAQRRIAQNWLQYWQEAGQP